jgi:hypothetical protein
LFSQVVAERNGTFRQRFVELLSDCCPSPFISDEKLDLVEMLANKVQELEANITYVESENASLVEELRQDLQQESNNDHYSKPRKRSSINECMFEPDESNEDALFNNNRPEVADARMRSYLKAMGEDLDEI